MLCTVILAELNITNHWVTLVYDRRCMETANLAYMNLAGTVLTGNRLMLMMMVMMINMQNQAC